LCSYFVIYQVFTLNNNRRIFHIVDFENETTAEGTADDPFEIANVDQLYSLFLKVHRGYSNNGQSYEDCHYKLTSDITLDGRVTWGGINLCASASFDGNGHTISGPIVNSFFSELFGGTSVKNLTLDLTIEENWHGGTLAREAFNATIINCHNKSDLTSRADYVGGLVSKLSDGSRMIACSNTGDVIAIVKDVQEGAMYDKTVGGLVGNLSPNAIIEGCYTTGTVTSNYSYINELYIGGLVGTIETDAETTHMTGCWTTATLDYANVKNPHFGDIAGQGTEKDKDYAYCIKIATTAPSFDNITSLNEGLTSIGSICRFNEQGIPVIGTASSGTANGSNFGDGGEF